MYSVKDSDSHIKFKYYVAFICLDCVVIYDTLNNLIACAKNLHLSTLTDATWIDDRLLVSSLDGFCSLVSFEGEELGEKCSDREIVENLKLVRDNSFVKEGSNHTTPVKKFAEAVLIPRKSDVEHEHPVPQDLASPNENDRGLPNMIKRRIQPTLVSNIDLNKEN